MPTYEYACTECSHAFEQFQRFTDDPLTQCPECAGRLRKVFGSVGVVFKGSGFYRTDSRAAANGGSNGSAKGTANGSGASQAKESAGAATKSDTAKAAAPA